MRVVVCRDDGTVGCTQEVPPGGAFVLTVENSNEAAEATMVGDADRVRIGPPEAERLDLSDRLMIGLALAFQFVWFVRAAAGVDHALASAFLLLAAAGWGYILRKAWRATR